MYPKMQLVNVVATATIDRTLDLQMVCDLLTGACHAKGGIHMVVVKWYPTFLILENGKVVCNGATSVKGAYGGLECLVGGLSKVIGECKVDSFRVSNLVAACKLGFNVNRYRLQEEGFWLDERFAGVTYNYDKTVRVICFHTGSVYMTGAKTVEQIETVWSIVYPLILKHKV